MRLSPHRIAVAALAWLVQPVNGDSHGAQPRAGRRGTWHYWIYTGWVVVIRKADYSHIRRLVKWSTLRHELLKRSTLSIAYLIYREEHAVKVACAGSKDKA